jgi:hypothetical protein
VDVAVRIALVSVFGGPWTDQQMHAVAKALKGVVKAKRPPTWDFHVKDWPISTDDRRLARERLWILRARATDAFMTAVPKARRTVGSTQGWYLFEDHQPQPFINEKDALSFADLLR